MTHRRIPQHAYFVEPWKNGLGTTDIMAEERVAHAPPRGWTGLVWRLARTRIPAALAFSDLSGFDRHQLVTDGDGLFLDGDAGTIDLSRRFVPVRYSGDLKLVSRLENGPVGVLNFMLDRHLAEGDMAVIHGPATRDLPPGRHLLVAAEGALTITLDRSRDGDTTDRDEIALTDGETLDIVADAATRITVRTGPAILCSIRYRSSPHRS